MTRTGLRVPRSRGARVGWWLAAGTVLCAVGLAGCEGESSKPDEDPEPIEVAIDRPECEFLNPQFCLAPWPSNRYLVTDASTKTGYRVDLPDSVMPVNKQGVLIDPEPWNRWDGFSPTSTLMTVLPAPIGATPFANWTEPERSLDKDSPTVLIDVASGERVAHFAEIEEHPEADTEHPTLYIRPAARLKEDRLYAVGIRGLTGKDGQALSPSPVFAALRDGKITTSDDVEERRPTFETEVFEPLAKAGVDRDSLHEAWSFRTSSGEVAWGDLVAMRDDALDGEGKGDLGCAVTTVTEDAANPDVYRMVEGTFTVPLYLDTAEYGGRITRDAEGAPQRNGTTEAPFLAIIPCSVADKAAAGGGPFRVVVYGHGLFSNKEEIARDFMVEFAQKYETVVFATEWWGLSSADPIFASKMLRDLSRFGELIDRVRQSYVNQLVMTRAARGSCAALPELAVNGTSVSDSDDVYYIGNSQGGSFGQTLAGLSPDIERFALGVGGVSYAVMLPRSLHWPEYGAFLKMGYPDRMERDMLMVMFSHHWDLIEGAAFAPHLLADPLPGNQPKRILYQIGLNDAQTPNPGSDIGARTIGLPLFTPTAGKLSLLETVSGEADSAVVLYDEGAPQLPISTVPPPEDTVTHEAVRRDPRAQAQIDAFLRPTGVVEDFCDGPCVAP